MKLKAQGLYKVTSDSVINIHYHPDSSSAILGTLLPQSQIYVIRFVNEWAELKYKNQFAYVLSNSISLLNSFATRELFEVISKSNLNIRSAPSTSSKILGVLKPGTQVEVFATTKAWAKIKYKDNFAYISSKYIRKIEHSLSFKEINDQKKEETEKIIISKIPETIVICNNQDFDFSNKIETVFNSNIYYGFSNFVSEYITPKGSMTSFGFDFAIQFRLRNMLILKNYFTEISLGYSAKGSLVFPMFYNNIKLFLGYKQNLFKCNLYSKMGLYTGFTYSSIRTNKNKFSSNADVGLSIGCGIEFTNVGIGILYERGFNKVCNAKLSLKNSCFFLNVSYKIF